MIDTNLVMAKPINKQTVTADVSIFKINYSKMKKLKFLVLPALLLSLQAMSQTTTPSDGSVRKTINKIGNKTAQIAVKGTSAIKDKKYDSKVGPNGETVYINKNS